MPIDGFIIFDADYIDSECPPSDSPTGPIAMAITVPDDTNDVSLSNNFAGRIGNTAIAIAVPDDANDVSSYNNNNAGLIGNTAIAITVPISRNKVPLSPLDHETLGGREDVNNLQSRGGSCRDWGLCIALSISCTICFANIRGSFILGFYTDSIPLFWLVFVVWMFSPICLPLFGIRAPESCTHCGL
jgi:hypothetical protein